MLHYAASLLSSVPFALRCCGLNGWVKKSCFDNTTVLFTTHPSLEFIVLATKQLPTTVFILGLLFAISCGDVSTQDIERPFDPPRPTTAAQYEVRLPGGSDVPVSIQGVGTSSFNGGTWEKYEITYPKPSGTKTVHVYGTLTGGRKIEIAGGEVIYPPGETKRQNYTVTLETPLKVNLDRVGNGQPQATNLSGEVQIVGQAPIQVTAAVNWTRTMKDAVVETEMGAVGGVEVYEGDATVLDGSGLSVLDLIKDVPIHGTVWFHPTLGLLKFDTPDLPVGAAMKGSSDCGDPLGGDWNTIQAVGTVRPGAPRFTLGTYDCSNDFDADKMRHAKMLLELRFADDQMAKSSTEPNVNVTFGTTWGYFPHVMLQSPHSIFHPEENGLGYTFWYALVDQAAKNELGDGGVAYKIEVAPLDDETPPIRATARIVYGVYRP